MMQALADLPPVVLCDLIGIQPRTAQRFAVLAGENWSDYLVSRQPRLAVHPTLAPPAGGGQG